MGFLENTRYSIFLLSILLRSVYINHLFSFNQRLVEIIDKEKVKLTSVDKGFTLKTKRAKIVSVKINVRYFLPHLTDDQDIIEVSGNTIGQCFEQLITQFPKAKRWLFGKDGNISNFIDIYLNLESTYPDELTTPVKDGDEIQIVMKLSGG